VLQRLELEQDASTRLRVEWRIGEQGRDACVAGYATGGCLYVVERGQASGTDGCH
jgi:hypothetical protein